MAYDGAEPCQLDGDDRTMARELFGDVDIIPPQCRRRVVHLCGARGGKSYVLCALRLLHLAMTVPLTSLAPGEVASALIVAPRLKLAQQTYRFVLGAARNFPPIANIIVGKPTNESFVLQRESGQVRVECLPATAGGDAIRARNYVGVALDEFAFFHSDDYKVNDAEVFAAASPRIMPGGQLIVASTAWASIGMMYDLVRENHAQPRTCLVSMAPTLLLNPAKRAEIEIEEKLDPENAAREFGCKFMDSSTATFFSHAAIEGAVDESLILPLTSPRGAEVFVGADTGFRRDSSALVVAYKLHDGTYVVADILELKPRPGAPLKPSEVINEFAAVCKRHGAKWLTADMHYADTVAEYLEPHDITFMPAPSGAEGKAASHVMVKTLLHQGRIRLPKSARLVNQMKQLIGRPLAGGGLSLESPRTSQGGHGDLLSAFVLAISAKVGVRTEALPEPVITMEEAIRRQTAKYWASYEEKRLDALAEQQEAEGPPGEWFR